MNNKFARVIAVLLCLVVVLGGMPIVAFAATPEVTYDEAESDYYKLISQKNWELAPGVVESEIVINNEDGTRRQVMHVVEVDMNNEYTKVIPSYQGMIPVAGSYGVQTMDKQAAYAEANGYGNVVAAMNISLSWYDSDYYKSHPELVGEPLGYMILDGVKYTNSQGVTSGAQTCLVINFDEKDGETRPADMPKVQIRSTSDAVTGWEEQVIPANFGFLVKDGKMVNTTVNHTEVGAPRSMLGVKADGTIVMVMNDGRQAPYSEGFGSYEMSEAMLKLGCVYAINGDGGGSSQFLSQRPGEEMEVHCSPSDGALRETTHGVLVISTAPATGEFEQAHISTDEAYYTPGSSVQFSAIGTDLVGTPAEIPANAVWKLADASFGTIENGLFVSNGTIGDVTAQLTVDGKVVGAHTIHIVMPDALSFALANMTVPFGKTVDLGLSATYDNKNVVLKASDVTFTLSDENIGTIDGFDFTAGEEGVAATAALLTAIVGDVSTTTNLSLGKGSEIVYDFENQDLTGWSIFTNYGKYGPKGPNGKVTDDNGNYWYHGQNERGYISIVDTASGRVKNGDYALAVECDFTQIYETGYHALNLMFPTIDCTDTVAIGFWLYIPYDARHAQLGIGAGGFDNGELFNLNEGWHYVTAQAKDNQFYYINISIDDRACSATGSYYDYITEPNLNGKYTFYIDDITLDYSTAVDDREAPIFSAPMVTNPTTESVVAMQGQTISYNNPSFEVSVVEDTTLTNAVGIDAASAKAYIDGKLVDCTYTNGKITLGGAVLSDGYHTVKFSIADKMGNESWTSGSIVVAAGNDAAVKVVPQDPTADRLLVGSLYWMDVVATNIETIDKVEMVFDMNNASSWELEGMTVAAGFTATYAIQADDNIATISIERTGDVEATGSAVLVSFPVRTWVANHTSYEGYEFATPTWLVNYGTVWAQSIELALEKGIVTFVDEAEDTFGMESILVDTELFFTNYSRKSVEGAQAWLDAKRAAGLGWHEHTATAMTDVAATCTTDGYTGRTFCADCNSVVDWGTIEKATGHNYVETDGVLKCTCGDLFNGELDGVTYIDGVIADGWVNDTYYYVDGEKLTGSHLIDGVMHTFDENGIYLPDFKYDGFYNVDDTIMYFVNNEYMTGVQRILGVNYNFDDNGFGYEGEYNFDGYICNFDDGVSVPSGNIKLAGIAGENAHFVLTTGGVMNIIGEGDMDNGYTTIGLVPWYDYTYRSTIKKVVIDKDITLIGQRAFINSPKLSEVVFEEGSQVKTIEIHSFGQCPALTSIEFPEGLETIKDAAFDRSPNLAYAYMPASVKTIGGTAFSACKDKLTMNVLEGTVAHGYAKYHKINIQTRLGVLDSGSCGENLTWTLYSDNSLMIDGSGAMNDYTYHRYADTAAPWAAHRGRVTKVMIGKDVKTIGAFAFYGFSKLNMVEFAADGALTSIGTGAFGYTSLTSVEIPATVKTIGEHAFYYSDKLVNVTVADGNNLQTIGAYAFRNCTSLETVYIPDSVTYIGAAILYACGDQATLQVANGRYAHKYAANYQYTVEVRASVPVIKYTGSCGENVIWALYDDGNLVISGNGDMNNYTYHKYGETASPWALYRSEITTITIGAGVKSIGDFAFYSCDKLTAVEFAANGTLQSIGNGAFGYCGMTTVTIPASVRTIKDHAFYYSAKLETVAFAEGSKLFTIGSYAFRNCTVLKSVYIPDSVTYIGAAILYACGDQVVLNVAKDLYGYNYAARYGYAYELHAATPIILYGGECGDALVWDLYNDGTLVISGTGAMTNYTYHKYGATASPWAIYRHLIKKVVIGSGVESIGDFAFYSCDKMTSVEFADDGVLKTIGVGAFGYTALTTVTIPATVEVVSDYAFYYSAELETFAVASDSKLTTVGSYAFRNCTSLKSVSVPTAAKVGSGIVYACGDQVVIERI